VHGSTSVPAGEASDGWTDVAGVGDLRNDRLVVATDAGPVLVVRQGSTVHAVHDECPHLAQSLSEGSVRHGVIRCAAHGYRWELATGHPAPCRRGQWPRPLGTVPVRVVEGRILLGGGSGTDPQQPTAG
jgi:nitrite reductase/ring-hydroxylating ferredoxin subunit